MPSPVKVTVKKHIAPFWVSVAAGVFLLVAVTVLAKVAKLPPHRLTVGFLVVLLVWSNGQWFYHHRKRIARDKQLDQDNHNAAVKAKADEAKREQTIRERAERDDRRAREIKEREQKISNEIRGLYHLSGQDAFHIAAVVMSRYRAALPGDDDDTTQRLLHDFPIAQHSQENHRFRRLVDAAQETILPTDLLQFVRTYRITLNWCNHIAQRNEIDPEQIEFRTKWVALHHKFKADVQTLISNGDYESVRPAIREALGDEPL